MPSILSFALRSLLGVAALTTALVAVLRVLPPPATAFVVEDALARGRLPAWNWRPASQISPWLLVAVVAAEDQHFASHHGFDFDAIGKAASHNRQGGRTRGASTISQQVAKNLFLWPGRSFVRKGCEAALTVMIEALWPKRRILEVYVNVAEMGDGIFGAEAASRHFFRHGAGELTREEAALLAAVLPDPRDYHAASPSPHVKRRQQWILQQMTALGGKAWLKRIDAALSASTAASVLP